MPHRCHAHGCDRRVPPRLFVCASHWRALPEPFKAAIWREYRPGQEVRKDPSPRYLAVQRAAVGRLAFRPGDEGAARVAAGYFAEAEIWRQEAIDAGGSDPLAGLPGIPPHVRIDPAKAWAIVRELRAGALG